MFPGQKKLIESSLFSSDAEVIASAETWLGGKLPDFFLSGLQKSELRPKKCIKPRWQYVEEIPILIAVACFLPGWAKDLSASPRT